MNLAEIGLDVDMLFQNERSLLQQRMHAEHSCKRTITDAWNTPADTSPIVPFMLAVLFKYLEGAGIASEFPLGFFYTMGGWLLHHDVHSPCRQHDRSADMHSDLHAHHSGSFGCGKNTILLCIMLAFLLPQRPRSAFCCVLFVFIEGG